MKKETKNVAVSVRNRLLNIANKSKRDYNAILRQYFQERFLYRISISPYRSQFILKGAFLLMTNRISKFRPTKDIDFLGLSVSSDVKDCTVMIKEIAEINTDDGVEFIADKIEGKKIKEGADFDGVRIKVPYKMDTIKGYFSIDIGFGDKITTGPYEIDYPTLLDFPSPKIFVYSFDSAVAEKFEAIVKLNFVTSRMKDFYDLNFIAENNSFNRTVLREAIIETFENRGTNLEDKYIVFDKAFKNNQQKQTQWESFIKLNKLDLKISFNDVVTRIQSFIEPIFDEKTKTRWNSKKWQWE
ncbi:MAG: nucleotidyl transferase AbiEii/AbiGii toxin family protein [Ignavibacteriaceae bacterium]|jgi:predicted nucleotidyltransferase component of viral defense system|nr:nucleotidyl transferase AbiEii/AbiGii toxin family protein [Ignavibacteriaceae bacterium]MCW8823192.1 nucleotidyl transferase AbiEii/AbiGii toxin family protein [Ignavibacteriaceae bacterium]MCW9096545.1 nucleotidyl transferase AbiEii/AbiGii toxin family protein [Ignavibacteriaceae bacterium]